MNPKIIYFVAGLIWGFLLTYLLIEVISSDFSTPPVTQAKEVVIYKENPTYPNQFELEILTSQYRIENGLNALKHNESLCEVADIRLEEIKTDWSHNGFDKYRGVNHPAGFPYLGENLATEWPNTASTFNSWKISKTHNENLLLRNYTSICVKCVDSSCVQLFGG